jgi:16S rRNA (guanine527-N7)-methyltransferase
MRFFSFHLLISTARSLHLLNNPRICAHRFTTVEKTRFHISDELEVFKLSELQLQKLDTFCGLLHHWNKAVNLISRQDINYLVPNHILPSLSLVRAISFADDNTIIDVGTGGGFPGIPLAIAKPNVKIVLLDSSKKKSSIVQSIARALELDNVEVVACRAEEYRRSFDFVIGRAVAPLSLFLSHTGHLLCAKSNIPGGGVLYLKGGDVTAELEAMSMRSHAKVFSIKDLVPTLPDSDKCIIYMKEADVRRYSKRNSQE